MTLSSYTLKPGQKLVLATHNTNKVLEISDLLSPYGLDVFSARELRVAEPEETGETFAENALLKAQACARHTGLPSLGDDSGLMVRALEGRPGIHTARWAGPDKDFSVAIKRLEEELRDKQDLQATVVSVLCLAWPDGHYQLYEGEIYGQIVFPPRGQQRFGFDPVFMPDGYNETFAEMDFSLKQQISHRSLAFRKFVEAHFHSCSVQFKLPLQDSAL